MLVKLLKDMVIKGIKSTSNKNMGGLNAAIWHFRADVQSDNE